MKNSEAFISGEEKSTVDVEESKRDEAKNQVI